jgi:hypothetical protein
MLSLSAASWSGVRSPIGVVQLVYSPHQGKTAQGHQGEEHGHQSPLIGPIPGKEEQRHHAYRSQNDQALAQALENRKVGARKEWHRMDYGGGSGPI